MFDDDENKGCGCLIVGAILLVVGLVFGSMLFTKGGLLEALAKMFEE